MSDKEKDILNRIEDLIIDKTLSNDFLVANIKLSGMYLNIKTKSDYSRSQKISYQGVKPTKIRRIENIFNVKFVIEND